MQAKKENPAIAEMLLVEGLDCQGFGNIYQFVMKDTDLHIYAKALYAFLCSYSGNGSNPYPKRDTITANLMSKSSYYKYLEQLIDNGYIQLKKSKSFPFKTTYILLSNPKKLQAYQQGKPADSRSTARLHMTGLKSEGYGNIPRVVMHDPRLTPQAKAIYAYLRSLSGMGGVAFPAQQDILNHLQIGRSTYNRHFQLLIACNYIESIQRRINGRFAVTDYYIIDNPDMAAVHKENHRVVNFRTSEKTTENMGIDTAAEPDEAMPAPCSQIWDTEERDTELWDTENWDTINNTNINNKNINNNLSYQSSEKMRCEDTPETEMRESYAQLIRENIEADILRDTPATADYLDFIVDIMLDTVTSSKPKHRINGQDMPHEVVKSRLLKLTAEHVGYVVDCLRKQTAPIRNIRSYMLTALYNAPMSMAAYIDNDLRCAGII